MIEFKSIEEKQYKGFSLITLKEAKLQNNYLVYDKALENNQLGVVKYNNNQFSDYQEFMPVVYNKNYLIQKIVN